MTKIYEHTAFAEIPADILDTYGNYRYYLTYIEDGYAILENVDTTTSILVEVLSTTSLDDWEQLSTLKGDWFVLHKQ